MLAARRSDILKLVSRLAGLVVAVMGCAALLGWALGIERLKSVIPGMVTMKANTAACFVLGSLSLWLAKGRRTRVASLGLAMLMMAIALTSLFEYLTGRDCGIDELFFLDPASIPMSLPPGRMSFATALAFVMTGVSLGLVATRRLPIATQYLTFGAILIPVFSLLAYLFGERSITLTNPFTSLAINTAAAFAVLGIGILAECSETGPMSVFVADAPGGASLRRLLPLSVALMVSLGFSALLGARAGLYTFSAGMVLFAVFNSVVLTAAVWVNGWLLNRTEYERRSEHDWLQMTLRSIGDAVIATDRDGVVQFLNPIAESLTGWPSDVARGRALREIFRIINETTRVESENPVDRVLATGNIVGLANHTVLIARDGREWPIDDSAAPIKDAEGRTTGVVLVFRDISEKHESARLAGEASATNAKFRTMFEQGMQFAGMLSTDGLVLEVNRTSLQAIGASLDQVVGRPIWDFAGWDRSAALTDPIREAVTEAALGRPSRIESAYFPADGSERSVDLILAPVTAEDGRVMFIAVTGTDITDRKRAEEELRLAARRKDEFLAMLAHELRNPLAAISNAVGVARRGGQVEQAEWSTEVITRQIKHLTRLIDDLLDVSRINLGKIDLKSEVIEITPILESAAGTVKSLIDERRHALDLSIDRGNLWVVGDPTRLEQVMVNLLNNAAKYSEDSGQIRLSAYRDDGHVVVTIADNGVGIPSDRLPEMFELFAQGDRSLARSEGGLGIGLTVVKKLVELHGGDIQARSDGAGQGSEFAIRLPAVAPLDVPPVPSTPVARPTSRVRVLVVDDNVDTARGMARLLKLIGHDVTTAFNGPDALELARGQSFEVILLDIGLPGMDGYEVAARLRGEEASRDSMIVAVTGYGQDEDRRLSKKAGFDFHLTKPIDHETLISLMAVGRNAPV